MRLQLTLPGVEPDFSPQPLRCPFKVCSGESLRLHQIVVKHLYGLSHSRVMIYRYRCAHCGKTFRVYPRGVTRAPTCPQVKRLGVLLYLLGLSYGSVSLTMDALGIYLCKSSVYEAVQATRELVPGVKREEVFQEIRPPAPGADAIAVKYRGKWLPLGLTLDAVHGLILSVDDALRRDVHALKDCISPAAEAIGANITIIPFKRSYQTSNNG